MTKLQHFWHLVVRFFGVLVARPLSPRAQDDVCRALTAAEAHIFWDQQPIDQRHAYDVALRVRNVLGDDREAIAAALLHDVGKRHSRLGPIGRSLATTAQALRMPRPPRWQEYLEHDAIGAADLELAGAGSLAIAFALGRQTGDPEVWATLAAADDGRPKAPAKAYSGNTMPPTVNP